METITGLYQTVAQADRAVNALTQAGFDKDRISILTRANALGENFDMQRPAKDVAAGAGTGAVGGGLAGGILGLLAGAGAIAIPGIGPVLAAGAIASALGLAAGGAGVGAAIGGILGAMLGLSIPEEDARHYAEAVGRGGILVAVQADESRVAEAKAIIEREAPLDAGPLPS